MALQVRLRHSLGEKSYALPARTADRPVTVGRSAQADLQIPSIHAAPVHCVLFVHDGKWVVQDAGGTTGTLVNGRLIAQPTVLRLGDTVTVGNEPTPPTLTVVATTAPAKKRRAAAAVAVAAPVDAAPEPAPAEQASDELAAVAAEDDDAVDLGAAAARYRTEKFYVPHGPRMSEGAMAAGIIVAVVLIGLIALLIYKMRGEDEGPQQASVIAAKPAGQPGASSGPRVVIINPPAPRRSAPAPQVQAEVEAPPPPPAPAPAPSVVDKRAPAAPEANADADAAKPDPRKQDADWQHVAEAHKFMAPGAALVVFADYRDSTPKPENAAELQKFTDEALDLLWWQRIKNLCDERDIAQEDLKKLDRDIAVESNADFRKKAIAERSTLQARKKATEEQLAKDFGYTMKDPPDLYDGAKLATMRRQRNAALYANFTKGVTESIKKTRRVPWAEK